jgi:hypothetical protein
MYIILRAREKTTDIYNPSGVYQMICKDCPLKYVGQTGRTYRTRYNEHIREIQTNGKTSKYAQRLPNTTHNYDNMERTMKILHVEQKGQMLDTLENYYIYTITKQGLQMNEISMSGYNPIYEFLTKTNSKIQNPTRSRIPYPLPPPLPLPSSNLPHPHIIHPPPQYLTVTHNRGQQARNKTTVVQTTRQGTS